MVALVILAVANALPNPKAKPDFTVQPGDEGSYSGEHDHHHDHHHHGDDLNAPPPPPAPSKEQDGSQKQCTLVKSETKTSEMCFYEPECETECKIVPQKTCQPSVEQECRQINVTACNVVQEEVCQTNYVTQYENKCTTQLEEKCRTT